MPADTVTDPPTLVVPAITTNPALTLEALTNLRAAAVEAIAETLEPVGYFGGQGPGVWSEYIDGALGGRSGTYCAAAHPELVIALIDELLNHPTHPGAEPLAFTVVRKSRDAGTGRPHYDAVDLTWQDRAAADRMHALYAGLDSPGGETYLIGEIREVRS